MFACVHSTKCVITTEQEMKNTLMLIHFCLIQSCSPQGQRKHFKCNCLRCCLTKAAAAAAAAAGFLDDINKLLQVITSAGKGKCRCAEKFIFAHVTLICCLITLQMFTWFFSSRYPNTEWNRSVQFSSACATEPIFLSSHYFERHRRALGAAGFNIQFGLTVQSNWGYLTFNQQRQPKSILSFTTRDWLLVETLNYCFTLQ